MRSRDTNDKTESSDEEFPGTDEKESACKVPSLVFNTTDEQTKILNDIISAMNPIGMPKIINIVGETLFCGKE